MEKLIKFYDDLTNSEKEIFDYIFNHQDEVKNMKIMDLAKKILVSKTLIINMTQKLGFSGYTDFKYYLKSGNIPKIKKDEYESIQLNLKEDIEKTFSLVNTKEIKNIVREIQKVKTIYVVARGTSKSVGSHLNHLLLTLGFRCIFLEDYNLITNVAKTLESNELVILISLSGKTDKVLEIARIAKIKKTKIVSITNFYKNPLSSLADFKLYCISEQKDTKVNDSACRIGMYLIVEIIIETLKHQMT